MVNLFFYGLVLEQVKSKENWHTKLHKFILVICRINNQISRGNWYYRSNFTSQNAFGVSFTGGQSTKFLLGIKIFYYYYCVLRCFLFCLNGLIIIAFVYNFLNVSLTFLTFFLLFRGMRVQRNPMSFFAIVFGSFCYLFVKTFIVCLL